MLAGGVAVTAVGWLGLMGKLPPNRLAGIRTPYTFSSEEAWYATHRHAGIIMLLSGVAICAASLAFMPFVFAGVLPPAATTVALGALAVVAVGGAVAGWWHGTRRAREELAANGSQPR